MFVIDFRKSKQQIINALPDDGNEWVTKIKTFLNEWWDEAEFIRASTSGSTGVPKDVFLKKKYVENSARITGEYFHLSRGKKAFLCLSPDYIAGKLMIVRAIYWEMLLYCTEPDSKPLNGVKTGAKFDFAAMVPAQLNNSLKDLNRVGVSKLIVGGGAVDTDLVERLKEVSCHVYATYGMTETITHIALKRLNGESREENFKVLEGVDISTDNRSCLILKAPHLTDEVIVTNDIVEIKGETYFKWLGRYDNVINSGGVKISPEQIEKKLSGYIRSDFFISSLKDEVLSEKVILVIEGKDSGYEIEKIRSMLPKYKYPKEIFYLEEFLRTGSGKIKRRETVEKAIEKKKLSR